MLLHEFSHNLVINTDSYKSSHYKQYPHDTEHVSSYIESRGAEDANVKEHLFFGLQMFLKEYFSFQVTQAMIDKGAIWWTAHGLPFNKKGWLYILNKYDGKLPLRIQALPEGLKVPTGTCVLQVVNTDPELAWLTSFYETALLRAVWYPSGVAALSNRIRNRIIEAIRISSDLPESSVNFKLHDFGFRGVSSYESGAIGGAAHLVSFMGSDTTAGILAAEAYYGEAMAGYSIPAAEHSTITSWGRNGEKEAFTNMIEQFGKSSALYAVVSDSYDVYNAASELWGNQLKNEVLNAFGTLVVRPDSGDPLTVPIEIIERLGAKFGYTVNSKGYKVLCDKVRVIQGDGINEYSIDGIINNLHAAGWSIDNLAFGMGGALLQAHTRDDLKWAMKASAIKRRGLWEDVYKDPVTDPGKTSKRGRLAVIRDTNGEIKTIREDELKHHGDNLLETVWENGQLLIDHSFKDVRALALT